MSIPLTAIGYEKCKFLFQLLKMPLFSKPTYFKVQNVFQSAIERIYSTKQASLLAQHQEKFPDGLVLSVDGRFDSPGIRLLSFDIFKCTWVITI